MTKRRTYKMVSRVERIYLSACQKLKDLNDDPVLLMIGPTSRVWESWDFSDKTIQLLFDNWAKAEADPKGWFCTPETLAVLRWSIEELKKIPEIERYPKPKGEAQP